MWWGLALKFGGWLLGLVWPAKDERDIERKAGEDLGRAKAGQAAAEGQLHDIAKGQAARDRAGTASGDILLDPHNAGPSTGNP